MRSLIDNLAALGRLFSGQFRYFGRLTLLFLAVCRWALRGIPDWREARQQLNFVGVQSLPVVLTTGAFTGMVLTYNTYFQFLRLGVESWTGPLVAKALVWQLGPVLVGLMLAGRVGCAITAELGTMNVTEQVDALRTMGVDPVRRLVLPRVFAMAIMTPVLTAYAMAIGIFSGFGLAVYGLGADGHYMWVQTSDWMLPYDYVQGLTKALFFGVVIALVSCQNGLDTQGGAEGVGKATTGANVISCISVLILNMWLTMVLMHLEPEWDWLSARIDGAVQWIAGLF